MVFSSSLFDSRRFKQRHETRPLSSRDGGQAEENHELDGAESSSRQGLDSTTTSA
jgi:hypothetical protein